MMPSESQVLGAKITMTEQAQFGFNFESEAELLATSVEETEQEQLASPLEVSTQSFLIPELEEEAKQREENNEPEIPWTDYIRMVQLFFNEAQHEEFRELTSKLAVLYGTKSVTDTVAEAMRRESNRLNI